MFDIIGDIHGFADELQELLEKLGYTRANGVFRHPERRVIFLGDFIDRGPQIREALQIVRPMVLDGAALAIMGNHELNALAYSTTDPTTPGQYLRRHNHQNQHQHSQTLKQLSESELADYLGWFRTLPLWLDLHGVRAVHACWDSGVIQIVQQGLAKLGGVSAAFLRSACLSEGPLFVPVEILLKGKETPLPGGMTIRDKDGHERSKVRTRWYLPIEGQTYRSYIFELNTVPSDDPLSLELQQSAVPYPADAPPVFVGHYWLPPNKPGRLAPNVACLDYSVGKGGNLCAYRWNGEHILNDEQFVWITGHKR